VASKEEYAAQLREREEPYAAAIGMIRGSWYRVRGVEFEAETLRILDALEVVMQERLAERVVALG
jgi:hypothetical protein